MKVKGWFIEGFGVFRDYEVRDLGDGLTIFAGPNEAGKSTLLAFIRGMLFGFGDGRSRESRYPPLQGGRHGGRLTLAGPEGDCLIERYVGARPPFRVTNLSGLNGDEMLTGLLGGADDRLFRSVFAFSLTELQSFDSLTAGGVSDRIFSAGVAGAGPSPRYAIRDLDNRAGALLKPRSNGTINTLLASLEEVRARIEDARRAATGYADTLQEEELQKAEIDRLGAEVERLRARIARCSLLAELWPAWHDLQTAKTEFEGLEPVDTFPTDAETRLAAVLQERRSADQLVDELVTSQRAAEARRKDLRTDDRLVAIAADVEQLHDLVALQRNLLQQLPAARAKLFQAKEVLDEKLKSLGPDWNEARVESFDRSIPRQEEVRGWQERLQRWSTEIDRLQRDLDAAFRVRDDLHQTRDRLATSTRSATSDEATLEHRQKALRRLRANLAELRGEETAGSAQDAIARDRERALRVLLSVDDKPLPAWLPPGAAGTGLTIAAGAIWLATRGYPQLAAGLGLTALVLAAMAWWLFRSRSKQLADEAQRDKNETALSAEMDDAISARVRHRHKAAVLADMVAEDSAVLELPARPSFQEVEDRDTELNRQRTEQLQATNAQGRLEEIEAKLVSANSEVSRLGSALESAQREATGDRTGWEVWKETAGLPGSLSPQGVLDYFEAVRVCRDCMHACKSTKAEGLQLAEQIGNWEDRARGALTNAGIHGTFVEDQLVNQIVELRRRSVEDQQARAGLSSLDEEIAHRAARIAAADTTVQRCREECADLFEEAGATDEVTFRSRLTAFQRRSRLKQRIQDLEARIVTRIGKGAEAVAVRAELATGEVEEWRQAVASAEPRFRELQQVRDEALGKHRDAQRTRVALESSGDVARLENEREGLIAELTAAVRQWRTVVLARALIEATLREFERNRQPEVLADASRMFAQITEGRYERIVREENAEVIAVMDAKGARRSVEMLSRGTAEQLYLCIRLALAAEFARRSQPLPLVMDDVFVNFDPRRALAVARVVAETAGRHQVLIFTCHPSTRDLLLGVDPRAALVELRQPESTDAAIPPPPASRASGSERPPEPHHVPDDRGTALVPYNPEPSILALLEAPPNARS